MSKQFLLKIHRDVPNVCGFIYMGYIQGLFIPCELMVITRDILWQHYLTDICQDKTGGGRCWCFSGMVFQSERVGDRNKESGLVYVEGAHCDLKTRHDQSGSGADMTSLFFLFTDLGNPAGVIKIGCLFFFTSTLEHRRFNATNSNKSSAVQIADPNISHSYCVFIIRLCLKEVGITTQNNCITHLAAQLLVQASNSKWLQPVIITVLVMLQSKQN